ncbi:MAG: pyridoxal 5'-phosphate synthase lyase subunit PdxS, partial [Methanomicrobiales archaeon]|nr:pyridoxal 5'-phosphate synthase lyase subunit PdxS [Methanomicrobiales archaeon]
PERMARAIVAAVNNFEDAAALAEVSKGLGNPMKGIDVHTLREDEVLQFRGR